VNARSRIATQTQHAFLHTLLEFSPLLPLPPPPGASRRSAGSAGVNERINTHVAGERAAYANTASRPTPCARVLRDNTRRLARGRSNACTLTRVIKIAELPFRCSCYGCKCRCRHCRRCCRRRHQRTTSARDSRPSVSPFPAPLPGDNYQPISMLARCNAIRRLPSLGVSCRRQVTAIFSERNQREPASGNRKDARSRATICDTRVARYCA